MGDKKGWNLLAARTAGAGGGRRRRACSAAADKVHERLIEVDAAISHVTNLLGFGERVGDIARLAGRACLQYQSRCPSEHRRAEGSPPACRVVAARIGGDNTFSRGGKGDHAGTEV